MKRGDIVQLGRHRLMCGDCTDQKGIARLFDSKKASTIIFSPPYKNRRTYKVKQIDNGCSVFMGAITSPPLIDDVQIFAVIGNLHTKGEQDLFYEPWLQAAQSAGWKRFSTYIWDKQHGLPGHHAGRLGPCFEWIFHLNKYPRNPIKWVASLHAGQLRKRVPSGTQAPTLKWRVGTTNIVASKKISDAVIRINPAGRCAGIKHPAVMVYHLPLHLLQSYQAPGGVVYDPMAGSGSTMIAAEILGLPSVMCEIAPEYCEIAIERYHKHIEKMNAPSKPKRKVIT